MLFGLPLMNINGSCALAGRYKTESERENFLIFEELYNRFSNIAVTRFEWSNLPESISERFLNQTLYLFGQAVFFLDPQMSYLALPCNMSGQYNIYYNPTAVNAYSFNYNRQLNDGEFVFIRNNPTCTPTAFPVFEYTRRMADILRTIDVLTKKLKQPYMFQCEEKQRMTYLNLIKNISDNELLILGTKNFGIDKDQINLIDLKFDPHLDELWDTYRNLENHLYTAMGIESVGQEKRERLLVDEVNSNNMVTQMSIETNLRELQIACEEINKKYGLNISVKARGVEEFRKEAEQNVEIYDNPDGTN